MSITNRRMTKHFTLAALLLAASGSIYGSAAAAPKGINVKDAEQWATAEKELLAKVKPLNDTCGSTVTAAYDDTSYAGISYDEARANAACKLAFDNLKEVCRTDLGKTAVRTKVTKYTCRFSKTGTRASLDGKEVIVHIDPKQTGIVGKQPGSYSWISAFKELL